MLIAWWIGHPLGGFIMAVCLRIIVGPAFVVLHQFVRAYVRHATVRRNRTRRATTGSCALLTNGEGFHNFHHRFPSDYRNGYRWYHWDPSKWLIFALSKVGLAWDLRRTSDQRIAEAAAH